MWVICLLILLILLLIYICLSRCKAGFANTYAIKTSDIRNKSVLLMDFDVSMAKWLSNNGCKKIISVSDEKAVVDKGKKLCPICSIKISELENPYIFKGLHVDTAILKVKSISSSILSRVSQCCDVLYVLDTQNPLKNILQYTNFSNVNLIGHHTYRCSHARWVPTDMIQDMKKYVKGNQKFRLVVGGLPGVGKTYIGKILKDEFKKSNVQIEDDNNNLGYLNKIDRLILLDYRGSDYIEDIDTYYLLTTDEKKRIKRLQTERSKNDLGILLHDYMPKNINFKNFVVVSN